MRSIHSQWDEEELIRSSMNSYGYRHSTNLRVREHDYNYRPCQYCRNHHRTDSQKCYIVCKYCHCIHFKQGFRNSRQAPTSELCPLMLTHASSQQNRKAFFCDACGGSGTYQKITTITYCEPLETFKTRVQQHKRSRQFDQLAAQDCPIRKVFKKEQRSVTEECWQCRGKGKVLRVIDCCERGCNDCGYSRIKINPLWQEMRLRGQPSDEAFPCRICSQQVFISETIIKLHCEHAFHRTCILQWLAGNEQQCYLCHQVDPYLEISDILDNLDKKLVVEKVVTSPLQSDKQSDVSRSSHRSNPFDQKIQSREQSMVTSDICDESFYSQDKFSSDPYFQESCSNQNQKQQSMEIACEDSLALHRLGNISALNDTSLQGQESKEGYSLERNCSDS